MTTSPVPPRRPHPLLRSLAVAVSLLGLATAGTTAALARPGTTAEPAPVPPAAPTTAAAPAVPRPSHTVVVVLENKNRGSVIGSPKAPYLNALAKRGANMSQSYGVTHPSQGNYVALFSGGQQGVTNDDCPQHLGRVANLGSQLQGAGKTFTGFSESLPASGYTGCSAGRYRRKHNPWVDFANLGAGVNRPLTSFPRDYSKLPTVSFVTPNMCSDMHDCSVATGDAWLKAHLDGYATWARTHHSLLVVTFDENQGGTVNQIPTLLVGQMVRPGVYAEAVNHYSLLRTLEDAYGLPALGHAATATPLRTIWTTSPKPATGVANGGFEARTASWVTSGSTFISTNHHYAGRRAARAGALTATQGDAILTQTVVVPAGRHTLSLRWQGRCSDKVSRAWATVSLKRTTAATTTTVLKRSCVKNGAWTKVSVAVSPGAAYTLHLVNHDDGVPSTPNRTYFDDVKLS